MVVGQRRSPGYVLCHVTGSLVTGEATGNMELGDAQWLSPEGIDSLLAMGWLPPGRDSSRWQRRWGPEDGLAGVSREVMALLEQVYRGRSDDTVIEARRCAEASCVVHAPRAGGWSPCACQRASASVRVRAQNGVPQQTG